MIGIQKDSFTQPGLCPIGIKILNLFRNCLENEYKKRMPTYKSETPTAISGQAIHRTAGAIKFCR